MSDIPIPTSTGASAPSPARRSLPTDEEFYHALSHRTMTGTYAAICQQISEWAGVPVSARPMTHAEKMAGQFKPSGIADLSGLSLCPYCGEDFANPFSHEFGGLTARCVKEKK